ncbi:MAG: hypothetical protein J7M08_08450 [Planctomycetes bacterium]|nr:hypothetical protein [Planctomycetota bacterium]
MEKLLRYATAAAITVFFATTWGLLLRQRLPAEQSGSIRADYDQLLPPGQTERSSQWDVLFAGARVGASTLKITRDETGDIEISSDTEIKLPASLGFLLGVAGRIDFHSLARVAPLRGLEYLELKSERFDTLMIGVVKEGKLSLRGHVRGKRTRSSFAYRPGAMLGSMISPLAPLRDFDDKLVGRSWQVEMINPLTGEPEQVTVKARSSCAVQLDSGPATCFNLFFTNGDLQWSSWVTADGQLVMQGTPFGIALRRRGLPQQTLEKLSQLESDSKTKQNQTSD